MVRIACGSTEPVTVLPLARRMLRLHYTSLPCLRAPLSLQRGMCGVLATCGAGLNRRDVAAEYDASGAEGTRRTSRSTPVVPAAAVLEAIVSFSVSIWRYIVYPAGETLPLYDSPGGVTAEKAWRKALLFCCCLRSRAAWRFAGSRHASGFVGRQTCGLGFSFNSRVIR